MSIITINIEGAKRDPMRSKADNIVAAAQFSAQGLAVNTAKAVGFATVVDVLKNKKPYLDVSDLGGEYSLQLGDGREVSEFGKPIRNKVILQLGDDAFIDFQSVKIDVTQQNTIVKTPLVGRTGTVKEYVKAEDHIVTLTGDLFSKMDKREAYPYEELVELLKILKEKGRVRAVSKYLEAFSIDYLVLENYQLNQSNNKYINQQHFSLKFISDLDEDYFAID